MIVFKKNSNNKRSLNLLTRKHFWQFFNFTHDISIKYLMATLIIILTICTNSFFNPVFAQKFSQTLELDWDGARPGGSCILCDDDYACSNGFGDWNNGSKSFYDSIPEGMVLTSITVKIQHACPGGSVAVTLNDQTIDSFGRSGIDCSCNSCFISEVSSKELTILSAYNFDGNNTIQIKTDSVLICIDRAIVQLDYEVAKTVKTVVSKNNDFCPGSSFPVDFIATGEFPANNSFRVELSDSQGKFDNNATKIGQILSTANSGTIMAELPEDLNYSDSYRIRVKPTTPFQSISDNLEDLAMGDKLAPQFENCPDIINIKTIPGETSTQVNWIPPTVVDQCSDVQLSSNFTPGANFEIGTHFIEYQAIDEFGNISTCTFEINVIDGRPQVTGFFLVDANNNRDIMPIRNNGTINLLDFAPDQELSIRAITDPDTTGSVDLKLEGEIQSRKIEQFFPYSVFGDFPHGNYDGQILKTGDYQLQATPYTEGKLGGIQGIGSIIQFKVIKEFRLSLSDDGKGNISTIPSRESFEPGSTVAVQANPDVDYRFLYWTDENNQIISTTNPYSFPINAHMLLKANFEKKITISDLIIVDANTDEEIKPIKNNDIISLEELPTSNLSIRAISDLGTVSVRFELNGPLSTNRAENIVPYSLFGEDGLGNYIGQEFIPGEYTLLVTPFYERAGRGESGKPIEISFTVVDKILPSVQQVNLIDAEKDIILQSLKDGDIIDIDQFDSNSFSLEAVVNQADIKSVNMFLKGPINTSKKESVAPFALFGDQPGRDFIGHSFPPGDYTLEIKTYSEPNLQGEAGNTLLLNFTILGMPAIKTLTLVNANTQKDLKELNDNDIISLSQLGNSISIRANSTLAGSVMFRLANEQGQVIEERVESFAPFTLFGETTSGKYIGWVPEAGKYSLTVIPYEFKRAAGIKGLEVVYHFEILSNKPVSKKVHTTIDNLALENQFTPNTIKIFPNPVKNELKILFEESTNGSVNLIIRDNLGNIVLNRKEDFGLASPQITLNLDQLSLSAGMYHITLKDGNHTYITKSFIKQ